MLNLINFITMLFWLSVFIFLLNSNNLITIILYSEIMWVILYSYTSIVGTINDDLILTSTSFFLLGLAGLEFCLGFLISILFRNFKKSLELDILKNSSTNLNQKNISNINKNVWSYF